MKESWYGFVETEIRPPFTEDEMWDFEEMHSNTDADRYLIVASTADPSWDVLGAKRSRFMAGHFTVVFATNSTDYLYVPPSRLSRDDRMRALTAKTALHEFGHVIDLGESDDRLGTEIYSGRGHDWTPEDVLDESRIPYISVDTWSVMSGGAHSAHYIPPMNETYLAISIEEWTSINPDPLDP